MSETDTQPLTDHEFFEWSSDLRMGGGKKFDRERLKRALAEVRRLREENAALQQRLENYERQDSYKTPPEIAMRHAES